MTNTPREIDIFRALIGSRIAEEAIVKLNDDGVLHDHHSGLGHEAIGVGVGFAVRDDDCVQMSHRTGMMLAHARGAFSLSESIHNALTGYPLHYVPLPGKPRVQTLVGLIGTWVPMSVGTAMADQLRGQDTVTVSFFGDGGANEGAVHEAMNLAGARKLPMVFVLENNGYGISLPVSESTGAKALVDRAEGYGMKGYQVDGYDVLAVLDVAEQAIERARRGEGPSLIEARVTRWDSHADGVPDVRTEAELKEARQHDCVKILKDKLLDESILSADEARAIEEECRKEVEAALQEADNLNTEGELAELDTEQAWNLTYAQSA